jgi:hypothetical protein
LLSSDIKTYFATLNCIVSRRLFRFLFQLLPAGLFLQAGAQADTVVPRKRFFVAGIPVVFYTPETRFGFGASAFSLFNLRSDSVNAPRSSVSLGFAYTQNRQVISSLPFNLFISNREYQVYGELAYNRFIYNFYGTGNLMPPGYVESYGVEFPRIRLTCLKKIVRRFYAGPRFVYDRFSLYDLAEGGLLETGAVYGTGGGTVTGPAAVFLLDSRDHIFYPTKGAWAELVYFYNDRNTGSSFDYTRIAFDASKYFSHGKNVLALNFYTIYSNAQLPFFQMGMLGGLKKMRGFYEGRYRDNNLILFQAEYRRELIWQTGVAVFGSMGQVASSYNGFHNKYWRYTYGAGFRFMPDKQQRMNLRIDFAVGNGKLLTYFTVGEAF